MSRYTRTLDAPTGVRTETRVCVCCSEPLDLESAAHRAYCYPCDGAARDHQDGICQREDARPPMPDDCLWDDPDEGND